MRKLVCVCAVLLMGGIAFSVSAQESTPENGAVSAKTIITIHANPEGVYEFSINRGVGIDDSVAWVNHTDVAHHLVITQENTITTKVTLESDETLEMRFHQAGVVHFECTDHHESGEFRVV